MDYIKENVEPIRYAVPGLVTVGPLVFRADDNFQQTQNQLHWQLCDLCRFHQVLYAEINCQASEQAARAARLAEFKQPTVADEDDREAFDIFESRVSESILLQDAETVRLKRYADDFTVIGLWAMAEQYMGRVYATAFAVRSGINVADVVPPSSWTKLKYGLCELGISVEALHSFSDADECRVLNNKIKHIGRVDAHLAKYSAFANRPNCDLQKLDFDIQRYFNGVANFLGSLIESCSRPD